ncbi:hypothetical protein AG1IA_04996 [Rhizoctonia solani AG-1 IA]|uniref:Uncharacterized protein n=1 Tax=Thanatephorus cucumeris (strain AG1-IA) TaxID=983506 RepID=L8WX96_THACA|nr:hypothetical protein AG1IA_04996 [Rhizoctonia solani AG-1 IA]
MSMGSCPEEPEHSFCKEIVSNSDISVNHCLDLTIP